MSTFVQFVFDSRMRGPVTRQGHGPAGDGCHSRRRPSDPSGRTTSGRTRPISAERGTTGRLARCGSAAHAAAAALNDKHLVRSSTRSDAHGLAREGGVAIRRRFLRKKANPVELRARFACALCREDFRPQPDPVHPVRVVAQRPAPGSEPCVGRARMGRDGAQVLAGVRRNRPRCRRAPDRPETASCPARRRRRCQNREADLRQLPYPRDLAPDLRLTAALPASGMRTVFRRRPCASWRHRGRTPRARPLNAPSSPGVSGTITPSRDTDKLRASAGSARCAPAVGRQLLQLRIHRPRHPLQRAHGRGRAADPDQNLAGVPRRAARHQHADARHRAGQVAVDQPQAVVNRDPGRARLARAVARPLAVSLPRAS